MPQPLSADALNVGLCEDTAGALLLKNGLNGVPDTSIHAIRSAPQKVWAPVPWMLELVTVIISTLATTGTLMQLPPVFNVICVLVLALLFGLMLDLVKVKVFRVLKIV